MRGSKTWMLIVLIGTMLLPGSASAAKDTMPPRTTITLDRPVPSSGWYTAPVRVTLTVTDDRSGVRKLWYEATEGNRSAGVYGEARRRRRVSFTVYRHQGVHTIRYAAVDFAGNRERTRVLRFKLDSHPPSVQIAPTSDTITEEVGEAWSRTTWNVYASCDDDASGVSLASGCARHWIALDDEPFRAFAPFSFSSEGRHVVRTRATDVAGNRTIIVTKNLHIDRTPPTVEMVRPASGRIVTSSPIRLEARADDPVLADGTTGSAVRHGFFVIRDHATGYQQASGFAEPTGDGTWATEVLLPSGSYEIRFTAWDGARNFASSTPVELEVVYCPAAPELPEPDDLLTCTLR